MVHDPYAPPTARLQEEPESRSFLPVLVALLAGVASWLVLLKAVQWMDQQYVLPSIEGGHPLPEYFDIFFPTTILYAIFGVATALLRAKPWWTSWPAFVVGVVLGIVGRGWPFPNGIAVVLGVFRNEAFLTAVVSSLVSFVLVNRLGRSRSNNSLERTREG